MPAFKRAAFYFVAHADDWQLFMMPEISKDIADKECMLCIVHTTAGDAGREDAFWQAREQGAIDSLLFRLSATERGSHQQGFVVAGNNNIYRHAAANCFCYFLRLPDGNYNGSGFERYGLQSLQRSFDEEAMLTAVDKSASYKNVQELADTIDSMIDLQLSIEGNVPITEVCINIPEPDESISPFDHNDHYNTARLMQSTRSYSRYAKRAFVHYNTKNTADLLNGEELFWKIGMFTAYHQAVYKLYGHSTITEDNSFIPWCFRSSLSRDI